MSGTERELRVHQLGSALRGLAAELVEERRKVAVLRREIAELRQRLEALQKGQGSEGAEAGGAGSVPGPRDAGPPGRVTNSTGEAEERRSPSGAAAAHRTGLLPRSVD